MGQQSEIFSRYTSLFNSNSTQPTESATARQLDNLDFVDFLFELVKATKGLTQFKNIILKGSLSQMKQVDEINNIIKNALISKFGCNSSVIITTPYTTKSTTGIVMTKSEIDQYGLLGIDPNGTPGKFLYDGNDITKNINYVFYKSQSVTVNNPISFNYSGRVLFTLYSVDPNTFQFNFGDYYENQKYGVWLSDYLTACSPIFNTVNFTTILTDIITGSISLSANKTQAEITQQSTIVVALQNLFGFCSEATPNTGSPSSSSNNILNNQQNQNANYNGDGLTATPNGFGSLFNNTSNSTTPNTGSTINPFNFSSEDLAQINNDADLKTRGVVNFVTCNNLEIPIDPNNIINGLNSLFGSADNDQEPYSYDGTTNNELPTTNNISNLVMDSSGNTIYDNSIIDPNVNNASNFFDTALAQGATNVLNSGETSIIIDLPNMNAELQLNILKAIPYALMEMVLSPKVLLIPKTYAVLSGDNTTKDITDFVNDMSDIITQIGSSITNMLITNIFNSIKSDLINLAKELSTQFIKQRGIDYLATLDSLLGLLNLLNVDNSGCGGVLNMLLDLLKLTNFGPMPTIPFPLILIGGALKPGLNQVAIVNDIKSNLISKGIETAPTLPDGTPNNMMIAIEETVKVITTHIKTNANISVATIGTPVNHTGYGQIQ